MAPWFFVAAGGLSALWLIIHLTLGERDVARPFLRMEGMDATVRETQYLCWHFTSVSIAAVATLFIWSAATGVIAFAQAATLLAAAFAVVGIGLVVLREAKHGDIPQGWLFLPVALLGLAGLLA